MNDEKILDLYWDRSERAIHETEAKYGKYLLFIAGNILDSQEDCIECLNDTLLAAWNAIPPARPEMLRTFLAKIMRNIALGKLNYQNAEKRGSGRVAEAIEELGDISDSESSMENVVERVALTEVLEAFLESLQDAERKVFIKRYWLFKTTREISEQTGLTESNVRVMLFRLRRKLKDILTKEGFKP